MEENVTKGDTDSLSFTDSHQEPEELLPENMPVFQAIPASVPVAAKSEPTCSVQDANQLEWPSGLLIPKVEFEVLESSSELQQACNSDAEAVTPKIISTAPISEPIPPMKTHPLASGGQKIVRVTMDHRGELVYRAAQQINAHVQPHLPKPGGQHVSTRRSSGVRMIVLPPPQKVQSQATSDTIATTLLQKQGDKVVDASDLTERSGMVHNLAADPNTISDQKTRSYPEAVPSNSLAIANTDSSVFPNLTSAPVNRCIGGIQPALAMPRMFPIQYAIRPVRLDGNPNRRSGLLPCRPRLRRPVRMIILDDVDQSPSKQSTLHLSDQVKSMSHMGTQIPSIPKKDLCVDPSILEPITVVNVVENGSVQVVPVAPGPVLEDTCISLGHPANMTTVLGNKTRPFMLEIMEQPTAKGKYTKKTELLIETDESTTKRKYTKKTDKLLETGKQSTPKRKYTKKTVPAAIKTSLTEEEDVKLAEENNKFEEISHMDTVKVEDLNEHIYGSEQLPFILEIKKSAKVKRQKKRTKKATLPKKVLTQEEKARNLERRRMSQYASWTDTLKLEEFEEYFSDPEESRRVEDLDAGELNSGSDFEPNQSILSSESEDDIEMEESDIEAVNEDDLAKKERRNYSRKPQVKGPDSAFTLEIIARILETTVEQLDAEEWNGKIKTCFDEAIFEELITLGPGRRRYKCWKCENQIHGNSEDVATHMKEKHNVGLMFGCLFCPLGRPTEKALKYHEKLHVHYNAKAACTLCDAYHLVSNTKMPEEIKDMDWRALHAQHHPPIEDIASVEPEHQIIKACKCVTCEDHPKRNQKLFNTHIYVQHVNVMNACHRCGAVMNFWKLIRGHDVHCKGKHKKGPFICQKCGVEMQTFGMFRSHDCSGRHNCTICGAKFTASNSLKRHTKNVHAESRRHTCQFCGKSFKETMVLEDHINTHTGEKPHRCLVCGTCHTSKAGLAMHLRSRHDLTTREMNEKYKDCPVPDEPPEEPRDRKGKNGGKNEKEAAVNAYTGRKRGRPKTRLESGEEKVKKPRKKSESTEKRRTKRKPKKASDSGSESGELGEHFLARPQPKEALIQVRKARNRNTSSDSSDDRSE